MKFGMFLLGPVPKPVDRDTWGEDQEQAAFDQWLDEYEQADKLGYDYLFVGEHHYQSEYCHIPAPEAFLAALTQRTHNARLGTSIAHISMDHNHPARVAERAAMLDILSHGRWEFGTGPAGINDGPAVYHSGTEQRETLADESGEIWEAGLREVVRMMTEEPYGGIDSEYFRVSPFTLVPRPVQKPHPPLWRSATSPESNLKCAHLGLGALNLSRTDVEAVNSLVEAYWKGVKDGLSPIGKAINPATAVFVPMFCARTDETAEIGRVGIDYFGHSIGHMRRDHSQYHHLARSFRDLMAGSGREGMERNFNASALVGSPQTICRQLRQYEKTNVDVVIFFHILGLTSHEALLESADLVANKVLPEFRDRQEEHANWRAKQLEGVGLVDNSTV